MLNALKMKKFQRINVSSVVYYRWQFALIAHMLYILKQPSSSQR